jgi:hypothetical protein
MYQVEQDFNRAWRYVSSMQEVEELPIVLAVKALRLMKLSLVLLVQAGAELPAAHLAGVIDMLDPPESVANAAQSGVD